MSDLSLLVTDDYLEEKTDINKLFEDDSDDKAAAAAADRKIKLIKILFAVFCFLLAAELVVYKYIMPSFSVPKISVTGLNSYSSDELGAKLMPFAHANWFDFDVEKAAAIISADAGIDSVTVEKKFPDRIMIEIQERSPVAMIFMMNNGISTALEIDKNGVLFPVKETARKQPDTALPIISGLPVEYMTSGMRIPAKYRPLIEQISKIRQLPQQYFASISEICVLPKEYGNYELALIPAQSKVRVLTDRSLNEDALKYMMIVLDVVNQLGSEVSEVDLRYGSVSYRTR